MDWDIFISHSTDDKDEVVRPLERLLSQVGLQVWLDEKRLSAGDSIREEIDDALRSSRFAIVVVSPSFLARHWPVAELNALMAREAYSGKSIIPVLHNISHREMSDHLPLLADRLCLSTDLGMDEVVRRIVEKVQPGLECSSNPPGVFKLDRLFSKQRLRKFAFATAGLELLAVALFYAADELNDSKQTTVYFSSFVAMAVLANYVVYAASLKIIACRLGQPDPQTAWIPIVNIFYLARLSSLKLSWKWRISCIVGLVSVIMIYLFVLLIFSLWPVFIVIFFTYLWSKTGQKLGRAKEYALLAGVPFLGKFVAIDLAYSGLAQNPSPQADG